MSRTPVRIAIVIAAAAAVFVSLYVSSDSAKASRGTAEIKGTVKFLGKTPKLRSLDMSSESACNAAGAVQETVLVSGGKLANVHVRIKSGTMGKHKPPVRKVTVSQNNCIYSPRVQGVMAGQKVQITNGDATTHNVHGKRDGGTWFNRTQPKGAKPIESDTGPAGETLVLRCDIHSWMKAYLPVTDHPYFDVTGKDGTFRIKNIPAGQTVTLEAWHEKHGVKTKQVKAGDTVSFLFP